MRLEFVDQEYIWLCDSYLGVYMCHLISRCEVCLEFLDADVHGLQLFLLPLLDLIDLRPETGTHICHPSHAVTVSHRFFSKDHILKTLIVPSPIRHPTDLPKTASVLRGAYGNSSSSSNDVYTQLYVWNHGNIHNDMDSISQWWEEIIALNGRSYMKCQGSQSVST